MTYYLFQSAPKTHLMIYDVRHGWSPLCKFLGIDIPTTPFPYHAVVGKLQEELLAKDPVFLNMYREVKILITLLCIATSVYVYGFVTYEPEPERWNEPWLANFFDFVCLTSKSLLDYCLNVAV